MLRLQSGLIWVIALSAGWGWPASAQEAAPPTTEKSTAAAADFDSLIKQLDAEDFAARQEASQRLAAAGEQAIPVLEKATSSDSRETSVRAFDILKGHFDKGAPGVKDSAKLALERIAKADAGSASRRATEILTPPVVTPPVNGRVGGVPIAGGIRIAGARIMVAGGAIGGGVESKIKIEDGVRTTEVKDKDRQVKIVDDPAKGLQLEVTETKDGKETTQKYEAKNAEELKTKNPEAHKIFEQYSQKGAEIKIGGFRLVPGAVPFAPGILPPRAIPAIPLIPGIPVPLPIEIAPAGAAKEQLKVIELLEKAIADAEASLKQAIKDSGDNEQLKKAQQRLEDARKQVEQLRSTLK